MARSSSSDKQLARELSELGNSPGSLRDQPARKSLEAALASPDARLVVPAARLLAARAEHAYTPQLIAAFTAFAGERAAHMDPGCAVKETVLDALESLECKTAEIFAEAAGYVQRERSRYGQRDTADGVRARGVLGLARLGHPDLMPILGGCLADRATNVRLTAVRAIGHRASRDAAGLLLLRLGAGEAEVEIVNEAWRALFAIAPDLAQRHAQRALAETELREQTLQALGAVPHDAAIALLADELRAHVLSDERRAIIHVIGLSRRDSARALLLELLHGDNEADAEGALEALAIHRYDERLVQQLRQACSNSARLRARLEELQLV